MQTWACGHEGAKGHSRLCPHLVGANADTIMFSRVWRGKGTESDLCCADCTILLKSGEGIEWSTVCEACVELLDENDFDLIEWVGQPEIEERLVPFNATLVETVLPEEVAWAAALAPLDATRFLGFWKKTLFLVSEQSCIPICEAPPATQIDGVWGRQHLAPRIHISSDERFAAFCHDYGRYGFVVDLEKKRVTMSLDKRWRRETNIPFPAAFFIDNGRNLLVHATDWMRLDISDPNDGSLLSEREGHYSPSLNGRLHVSPDSQWIVADQQAGGEAGRVVAWNLSRLLEEKVWESKSVGPHSWLCSRHYVWNIPIAWVDNERVAVWGIGPDEDLMLNGARVFNVTTGKETATFAGPSKTAFFGGDGRLFSVEEDGLHIWDAEGGERLGRINGFKPHWQRGDFLIELNDNRVRSWNWNQKAEEWRQNATAGA